MTQAIPPTYVVLYADDDPDDLQLIIESFAKYSNNVEVQTVRDGHEVMEYLKNIKSPDPTPCLIILDINMPRSNGKETLQNIRKLEQYNEVPVILFTTSSLPMDIAFARKHKAGLVTKPLSSSQMLRVINEFIDHCSDDVRKSITKQFN